ncbi:hypothetical protein THTE_2091 [Thermogutta terrifontis]|uniref:Uncharacterized protein n=1 Tax=Thermogutta terrifontis TaxID=1331910 RepID=A0A286RFG1_9BACT|nr:hypothetical protein THTE_2091 [Thermogutta terrifontis]
MHREPKEANLNCLVTATPSRLLFWEPQSEASAACCLEGRAGGEMGLW